MFLLKRIYGAFGALSLAPVLTPVLTLVLTLALATPASAQISARVTLTVDRTAVQVGDTLRLTARADVSGGAVTSFELPNLDGFTVRSRQVSRPMQVQFGFGGGQQRIVTSTTIHSLVLQATRAGRFEFSPVRVRVGSRDFASTPVVVVVGGAGANPVTNPAANPAANPVGNPIGQQQAQQVGALAAGDAYVYDPEVFVRVMVDNTEPFVGEQIEVTVFLYARTRIRTPMVTHEPGAEGFWVQDLLPPSRTLQARSQVVNGVRFDVYEIRRFAAFPLGEGELTIGGTEMRVSTGSIGDIFTGRTAQNLDRVGPPVTVTARALPAPVPSPVLVGNATLEVSADRTQVRTGDAITLTATIRGTGNLRDVRLNLGEQDGLEILEPQIEDMVSSPNGEVGGSRSYEWLIVPERPGQHTLPGLQFSTFDVETEMYARVVGDTIQLTAAGNAIADVQTPEDVAETVREATPAEYAPIRNESALQMNAVPLSARPWYWAIIAAFPFMLLLLFAGQRLRARAPNRDAEGKQKRKKRLAEARKHAAAGASSEFYRAIAKTLTEAVEHRLNEPIGSLTAVELHAHLIAKGLAPSDATALTDELQSCDFARFASGAGDASELDSCLTRATRILKTVDNMQAASS